MRFIHTGDWHLGRLFHNLHLTDDQRYTLEGLLRLAEEEEVDAVVIAGDVYDRAVPPTPAVELLDDVLAELVLRLQIPVVMIAGNHDSPVRLQYLNGLIGRVGAHVVGEVAPEPQGVTLTGRDGVPVAFWPLAYTDPETARYVLGRDDIHTHEAVLTAQLDSIRERIAAGGGLPDGTARGGVPAGAAAARQVIVGHAFVTGAATSESERPLSVGGSGEVSHEVFDGFDYVALGHLHRPQRVSERVRYAGSLLKYSFDECDHRKSVSIVELGADGSIVVEQAELPVRHDLVRLRGSFTELMERADAPEFAEAYVEVTLTGGEAVLDPMERLRDVYPHILSLRREELTGTGGPGPGPAVRSRTTGELFWEFYADVTGGVMTEAQAAEVTGALTALGRDEREVVS